ncbi:proline-rich protein 14 isoform X3 [Pseudonaja textilis]|uniref:proline-rich protein 14 isoform X3 n=1 Tax=Pseudonaja textilis TaxID=8673 RepID=UPI000EAA4F81|nr:proline-rich protein 14 isoform X3 [Pseudonaja textilis]
MGDFPIPDPRKVLGLNPAMECTLLEGTSAGGHLPLSALERIARRRKIIFKPAAEEEETPVRLLHPLDRGRTSSPLCQDEQWSPTKKQRLQQSSLPMAEEGRDACGRMGETLWRMASPMEKKQRKVLAIDLEDFSTTKVPEIRLQRPALFPSPKPFQLSFGNETKVSWSRNRQDSAMCRSDQRELPYQSSSMEKPVPSDPHDQEHPTGPSSETSRLTSALTLLRPSMVPRFRPWGLAPVFQSMRSKLEAFADIFLSPSKSSVPPAERSPSPPPDPPANEDEAATSSPATPRPGVKIEMKIAISEPCPRKRSSCHEEEKEEANRLVVSRRPPIRQWHLRKGEPAPQPLLGRSNSCPDFPRARSCQNVSSVLSPLLQLRQRRHTVCSLEVSRELDRPTLPCLRKEVYPFSSSPARRLPPRPLVHAAYCDPSSCSSLTPSCCPEPDPVHSRNASLSPDGAQRVPAVGLDMVASEQLMLSEDEMKGSQDNTVGKVSCIRIRKTPAKHQANLTPMGLPRPVRLNKEVFSLEEIYTNKNYHTPKVKSSFETIFEVPLERNGALVFTSQRKLKRVMKFQEMGLPRKQRKSHLRKGHRAKRRRAQPQSAELEEMLRQKLAELDALFEEEVC